MDCTEADCAGSFQRILKGLSRNMAETSFTKEQVAVIEHHGGHAVVAAVAGSGKTETLLGRVRHLLRDHDPSRIAVVMFNRDAAAGFRNRFEKMVGGPAPEIRTFNSMGFKIVNRFVQIGLLPEARIEEKDFRRTKIAKECFTRAYKDLNGEDETPEKELIDAFISFLLLVKSDTRSPQEVFESGKYLKSAQGFVPAFHLFEKERGKRKIRFFEDQVYDPVMKMLRNPECQRYVADKVDHLIVDEAQDMNGIQIALLRILAGTRGKVMLVGDEDQAIYDWRGSKPDYLTRGFEKDFPDAVRYTLPHTFRFGHELSLAASHLITHNANRNPKISISADGTPRTRIRTLGLALGLTGLGDTVKSLLQSGIAPEDIAVLVRAYSMSVSLELELHYHNIPFFVYGRPPLNRIPEISALVGVLKLASGEWRNLPQDEFNFVVRSLLSRPSLYLDKVAIDEIVGAVARLPDSLSEAIRGSITAGTKAFHADQIRDRADLLEIIATTTSPDASPAEVLDLYLQGSMFDRQIEKQSPTRESAEAVMANVSAFKLIASRHEGSISEFLEEIDPLIDSSRTEPPKDPHVWIGSIHRSKGAQWPFVLVPGLAASSFPREGLEAEQLEAERRLFYVAATRASEELYLAHPVDDQFQQASTTVGSDLVKTPASPVSRFLWEMDLALARHAAAAVERQGGFDSVDVLRPGVANEYFKRWDFSQYWSYGTRKSEGKVREAEVEVPAGALPPGARVRHPVFGAGKVDRWVDGRVVRVVFDSGDTRMLVAGLSGLIAEGADNPVRVRGAEIDEEDIPF